MEGNGAQNVPPVPLEKQVVCDLTLSYQYERMYKVRDNGLSPLSVVTIPIFTLHIKMNSNMM